jgi:hypothetical protein
MTTLDSRTRRPGEAEPRPDDEVGGVALVIVTWNSTRHLAALFNSLDEGLVGISRSRVVVVDEPLVLRAGRIAEHAVLRQPGQDVLAPIRPAEEGRTSSHAHTVRR